VGVVAVVGPPDVGNCPGVGVVARARLVIDVPVGVAEKTKVQVVVCTLPVTPIVLLCANALPPATASRAPSSRDLAKVLMLFFIVIFFKVKRELSKRHAPMGAKSLLVWMLLSRPHQLVYRLKVDLGGGKARQLGGD